MSDPQSLSVEESAQIMAAYQADLLQPDPGLIAKNLALARDMLVARAAWYRAGMPYIEDKDEYWRSGDLLRDVALDIEIALGISDRS